MKILTPVNFSLLQICAPGNVEIIKNITPKNNEPEKCQSFENLDLQIVIPRKMFNPCEVCFHEKFDPCKV